MNRAYEGIVLATMSGLSRGTLSQLPALSIMSFISSVLFIVVFSTQGWIGSDTLSVGIWTTCSWGFVSVEWKTCEPTQDYVSSAQSDSWVTQTQVIFVFTLLCTLLSTATIIASNSKNLSMVQNPALVFVAMCAAWAAGVFGIIGIIVMGIRQSYDSNFQNTSLDWSFYVGVVTIMLFFLNAIFMFWKFCMLNEERISIKTRRTEARRKVLEEARQTASSEATRETSMEGPRGYTGTGVTHQPRPATVGGSYHRGNRQVETETPPPKTDWAIVQQAAGDTQGSQLPASTQTPDDNQNSRPASDSDKTHLFQVKTPRSMEERMGLKNPAKSALMFQVAAPQHDGRETEESEERGKEDTYVKTPTPANTSQEEEEIEMDDEDFHNKMRRQEEYMKRRLLFTTQQDEGDATEEQTTLDSPGITPQPMMPVSRLPPIQLHNKSKPMKKKKKKRERSVVVAETTDESTRAGAKDHTDGSCEDVNGLEAQDHTYGPYEAMKEKDPAYEEVNILQGSSFGAVKMLEEEEEPKPVRTTKRRKNRDLSHVDTEA